MSISRLHLHTPALSDTPPISNGGNTKIRMEGSGVAFGSRPESIGAARKPAVVEKAREEKRGTQRQAPTDPAGANMETARTKMRQATTAGALLAGASGVTRKSQAGSASQNRNAAALAVASSDSSSAKQSASGSRPTMAQPAATSRSAAGSGGGDSRVGIGDSGGGSLAVPANRRLESSGRPLLPPASSPEQLALPGSIERTLPDGGQLEIYPPGGQSRPTNLQAQAAIVARNPRDWGGTPPNGLHASGENLGAELDQAKLITIRPEGAGRDTLPSTISLKLDYPTPGTAYFGKLASQNQGDGRRLMFAMVQEAAAHGQTKIKFAATSAALRTYYDYAKFGAHMTGQSEFGNRGLVDWYEIDLTDPNVRALYGLAAEPGGKQLPTYPDNPAHSAISLDEPAYEAGKRYHIATPDIVRPAVPGVGRLPVDAYPKAPMMLQAFRQMVAKGEFPLRPGETAGSFRLSPDKQVLIRDFQTTNRYTGEITARQTQFGTANALEANIPGVQRLAGEKPIQQNPYYAKSGVDTVVNKKLKGADVVALTFAKARPDRDGNVPDPSKLVSTSLGDGLKVIGTAALTRQNAAYKDGSIGNVFFLSQVTGEEGGGANSMWPLLGFARENGTSVVATTYPSNMNPQRGFYGQTATNQAAGLVPDAAQAFVYPNLPAFGPGGEFALPTKKNADGQDVVDFEKIKNMGWGPHVDTDYGVDSFQALPGWPRLEQLSDAELDHFPQTSFVYAFDKERPIPSHVWSDNRLGDKYSIAASKQTDGYYINTEPVVDTARLTVVKALLGGGRSAEDVRGWLMSQGVSSADAGATIAAATRRSSNTPVHQQGYQWPGISSQRNPPDIRNMLGANASASGDGAGERGSGSSVQGLRYDSDGAALKEFADEFDQLAQQKKPASVIERWVPQRQLEPTPSVAELLAAANDWDKLAKNSGWEPPATTKQELRSALPKMQVDQVEIPPQSRQKALEQAIQAAYRPASGRAQTLLPDGHGAVQGMGLQQSGASQSPRVSLSMPLDTMHIDGPVLAFDPLSQGSRTALSGMTPALATHLRKRFPNVQPQQLPSTPFTTPQLSTDQGIPRLGKYVAKNIASTWSKIPGAGAAQAEVQGALQELGQGLRPVIRGVDAAGQRMARVAQAGKALVGGAANAAKGTAGGAARAVNEAMVQPLASSPLGSAAGAAAGTAGNALQTGKTYLNQTAAPLQDFASDIAAGKARLTDELGNAAKQHLFDPVVNSAPVQAVKQHVDAAKSKIDAALAPIVNHEAGQIFGQVLKEAYANSLGDPRMRTVLSAFGKGASGAVHKGALGGAAVVAAGLVNGTATVGHHVVGDKNATALDQAIAKQIGVLPKGTQLHYASVPLPGMPDGRATMWMAGKETIFLPIGLPGQPGTAQMSAALSKSPDGKQEAFFFPSAVAGGPSVWLGMTVGPPNFNVQESFFATLGSTAANVPSLAIGPEGRRDFLKPSRALGVLDPRLLVSGAVDRFGATTEVRAGPMDFVTGRMRNPIRPTLDVNAAGANVNLNAPTATSGLKLLSTYGGYDPEAADVKALESWVHGLTGNQPSQPQSSQANGGGK